MLKWLPFEALETQGQALQELYTKLNQKEKPLLSEDQLQLMQYHLEEALNKKLTVEVKLYYHGVIERVQGRIKCVDFSHRTLILDQKCLDVDAIIDLSVL